MKCFQIVFCAYFSRFVNFAILRDYQRPSITLSGCPIPDPEGPYDRDPLPTIYPPTTTPVPTGKANNLGLLFLSEPFGHIPSHIYILK